MSDTANTVPILIVDDDPIVRSLMQATAEVKGYRSSKRKTATKPATFMKHADRNC